MEDGGERWDCARVFSLSSAWTWDSWARRVLSWDWRVEILLLRVVVLVVLRLDDGPGGGKGVSSRSAG